MQQPSVSSASWAVPVYEPPSNGCNGGVIAVVVIVIILLIVAIVLAAVWGTQSYGGKSQVGVIVVDDGSGGGAAPAAQLAAPKVRASSPDADAVKEVTEAQAKALLAGSDPVLVMIYASWCGFCKKLHPIMEELVKEHPEVKIVKLENTKCDALCKANAITGFPTMLGNFGDKKWVGYKPKEGMKKVLQSASKKGGAAPSAAASARFQQPHQQTVHQRHNHNVRAQHQQQQQQGGRGGLAVLEELSSEQQARQLLAGNDPVIVAVVAPWCGFCKKMEPLLNQMSQSQSKVKIVKIIGDNCGDLCKEKGINGFPTLLYNWGDGMSVGYKPMEGLMEIINSQSQ